LPPTSLRPNATTTLHDIVPAPHSSAPAGRTTTTNPQPGRTSRTESRREAASAHALDAARGLRRHRGVALRAGAGAALLLGVTAAVDGIVELGTAPASAAALPVGPDGRSAAASHVQPALALEDAGVKRRSALIVDQAGVTRREVAASRSAARDPRSVAGALLAARGWSGQFGCLDALWQRESGWNPQAHNSSSGAFGIPQALPGSKMASAGADWRTNPGTQIRWGLGYIASRYGTPCAAWSHSQATGWY
jgi:hypothetical protein